MYRDDLEAAHARVDTLQRELANAQAGNANDRQRIADLSAQLAATRHELQRLGGVTPGFYLFQPRGTTILVLGVLSLVLCNLLGPVAWVMGNEELRRLNAGQVDPMSRNSAVAGRILGIVSSVLMMVALIGVVGLAVLMGMSHAHY
jgi:hypothetical protein